MPNLRLAAARICGSFEEWCIEANPIATLACAASGIGYDPAPGALSGTANVDLLSLERAVGVSLAIDIPLELRSGV